jgi:hypothetical protein
MGETGFAGPIGLAHDYNAIWGYMGVTKLVTRAIKPFFLGKIVDAAMRQSTLRLILTSAQTQARPLKKWRRWRPSTQEIS